MNDITNPNYCPLFFKGMYAWADGKQSHVGHCCVSGISEDIPTPDFYHPYLRTTRDTWHLEPRAGCYQCWDTERRGLVSNRQHHINWIKDLNVDPTTTELLRLDFTVGSACNAKCIMCNAGSSTTWAAEDAKFGIKKYRHNIKSGPDIDQITQIDVSNLKQVYFTGGEPFMSHRLTELLKHVQRTGNISELEFSCNTNGSVKPGDELIELWKQCKSVQVYCSIDAIGREFEYIRNPLNWNAVESNIKFMQSTGVQINIAVAVGVHNIDVLEDLYNWFQTLNLQEAEFAVNRCWGDLDLNSASEALKTVWRQQLAQVDRPWRDAVLSMVAETGQKNDAIWQRWLATIDRRRGYQWQQELPKLAIAKNKAQCYNP